MSLPKLALRELSRGFGRLIVPGICVAVAVASQASVGIFNAKVDQAMNAEARAMAGADFEISGAHPIGEKEITRVRAVLPPDTQSVRVREFLSMASDPSSGRTRLVEVRAVGDGFPFYGGLETDPPLPMSALDSKEPTVFAQPEILPQLGVPVGGTLRLGELGFRVAAFVRKEPGPGGGAFSLGPKVWFNEKFLPQTGLDQRGSRVKHRLLFALPDAGVLERLKIRIEETLSDPGLRVRTFHESSPQLRSFYDRLDDFLSLLSLLVFLLAGVGVMSAVRSHLRTRISAVAIMRCYGATRAQVASFFLIQALALGVIGSGIGVGAGLLLSHLIPHLLSGLIELPQTQAPAILPMITAFATGVTATLLFALLSLVELPSIRPGILLRAEPLPARPTGLMVLASGAVFIFFAALASFQTRSVVTGTTVVASVAGAAIVLYFFFLILVRSLSLSTRLLERLPFIPRYGLRNFTRTRGQAAMTLSVLSLGAMLLGTVSLLRAGMLKELSGASNPNRPELFLLDVGDDQKVDLNAELQNAGRFTLSWAKLIKARLTSVNNAPVTREAENVSRSREFNLSERDTLYDTERIVAGQFWRAPALPAHEGEIHASLESGFAKRMGVGLGDRLDFEIQGVPVPTRVTSLRDVKWATFQPNFFVLLQPGGLEGAPFTWIGTVAGARGDIKLRVQETLVRDFPTITVIDIEEAGGRLLEIAKKIEQVIRFLSAFAILAGLSVMTLIALDNAERRARETALLKVLGGTRSQLLRAALSEFILVALLSMGSGWLGAIVLTRGWIGRRFGIETPLATPELFVLLGMLGFGVILLGIISSARAFQTKPVLILKSE